MKRKLLNLLISSTSALPLVTTASLLSVTSCSKDNEEKIPSCVVKGTVVDGITGKTISDVSVSCNEQQTKTNELGEFEIECLKPGSMFIFEKDGYLLDTTTEFSYEEGMTIELVPNEVCADKDVKFQLANTEGVLLANTSITLYPGTSQSQRFTTDNTGQFTTKIKKANNRITPIPWAVNNAMCDSQPQIEELHVGDLDADLIAQPYQYDVRAFVANDNVDHHIIMHAHHFGVQYSGVLKISLEGSWTKAFDNNFTLTFRNGLGQSSPIAEEITGKDFSIDFNSSGVTQAHGKAVEGKDIGLIDVELSRSKLYLDITIPEAFYDFSPMKTIGIHLAGKNGSFQPFDHKNASTKVSNQLSYIRLDNDNSYYQASDNANPFVSNSTNLDWETKTGSDWIVSQLDGEDFLGEVGPRYNFGYKIKLAKKATNADGIYILTKYMQPQMSRFLPDGYQPHFFFDTHKYDAGQYPKLNAIPTDDKLVKHYSPYSGYWMKRYTVLGQDLPFEEETDYDEIFVNDGAQIYSKEDLMITYIPFKALGIEPNAEFGFTCNLQYHYTGGEWFAWDGDNPTGFNEGAPDKSSIPHFEYLVTYIRFDSKLGVIPYVEA